MKTGLKLSLIVVALALLAASCAKAMEKRSNGAFKVTIPAGDLYTSVERGVVDGVVLSHASIKDYGLEKLLKYGTELGMGSPNLLGAMNWDFCNSLPPDLKKVVDDISLQMGGAGENWIGHTYDNEDNLAFEWFIKFGMELPTFPPAEKAKLVAAVSGVYQKWLDELKAKGLPGREVLEVLGVLPGRDGQAGCHRHPAHQVDSPGTLSSHLEISYRGVQRGSDPSEGGLGFVVSSAERGVPQIAFLPPLPWQERGRPRG